VRRLRGLTLVLLPVEVDPNSISEPTSRVITPQVISAYRAAAGDFQEAVSPARHLPVCLRFLSYRVRLSSRTACFVPEQSLCGMPTTIQQITEKILVEVRVLLLVLLTDD